MKFEGSSGVSAGPSGRPQYSGKARLSPTLGGSGGPERDVTKDSRNASTSGRIMTAPIAAPSSAAAAASAPTRMAVRRSGRAEASRWTTQAAVASATIIPLSGCPLR